MPAAARDISVADPGTSAPAVAPTDPAHPDAESVVFAGTKYCLRTRQHDQFVFTPSGQEDPARWADMITLICDSTVSDGKGLAEKAIACWQGSRDARATIWHINYVPRLDQMPARSDALYVLATALARPEHNYDEFAYTTIRFVAGVATTARYSHREYREGRSSTERVVSWLTKNESLGESWFTWDGAGEFVRSASSASVDHASL